MKNVKKDVADKLAVSKRQKEQLNAAHKAVVDAVLAVGDLDLRIAQLEAQLAQARQKAADAIKAREEAVRGSAGALDLDIEKESWNYDFASGEFTKLDQQQPAAPAVNA